MKILTAAEMREVDRLTSAREGISAATLMENAGSADSDKEQADFAARLFVQILTSYFLSRPSQ